MMGTAHGGLPDEDLVGSGEDRISGLPDDLLHSILLRANLGTFDAARTSVLSRRWRRVWSHLPDLSFIQDRRDPDSHARARDRVDAALEAYSAPTASRLDIFEPPSWPLVPVSRVASWLGFASRRLAGELRMSLRCGQIFYYYEEEEEEEEEELVIPLCERATAITIHHLCCTMRFRLPPDDSAFAALAKLEIRDARLVGRELEGVVSSRCPRLKELALDVITLLPLQRGGDAAALSIRSTSLECLKISYAGFGRLQVAAPELQKLFLTKDQCHTRIVAAPKLAELYYDDLSSYDNGDVPISHQFIEAGRHLRRMGIRLANAATLMRQFDTVDELVLGVYIPEGVQPYERFLEDTNVLPKCKVLKVFLSLQRHALEPTMLRLLRKCVGIKKLVFRVNYFYTPPEDYYSSCKLLGCPCDWLDNHKAEDIIMDSLEEVEIENSVCRKDDMVVELVKLLCKCSMIFREKVHITISEGGGSEYLREKIRSIHSPTNNVEITIQP
ncbi:unnamed protein product [Urochloa decumbens]|uniref:F-box domain-containing protein n=1 Tax=Urochloa decumbens TaxID=240449 RepID=A0ABC9G210_9POAL